jgi:hypothetical protein
MCICSVDQVLVAVYNRYIFLIVVMFPSFTVLLIESDYSLGINTWGMRTFTILFHEIMQGIGPNIETQAEIIGRID